MKRLSVLWKKQRPGGTSPYCLMPKEVKLSNDSQNKKAKIRDNPEKCIQIFPCDLLKRAWPLWWEPLIVKSSSNVNIYWCINASVLIIQYNVIFNNTSVIRDIFQWNEYFYF